MEDAGDWPWPKVGTWSSLNDCFHDATLKGLAFDPAGQSVILELELGFPPPPQPHPDRVSVTLTEATRVLVFAAQPGPNPPKHTPDLTTAQWQAALEEHYAKAVTLTFGAAAFAEVCASEDVEVLEAAWGSEGALVTLDFQGYTDTLSWYRLLASGRGLALAAEGSSVTMDELLAIGRSGWEALGSRESRS